MKKFEEKTIKTERIFEGKIINLRVDDVVLPDGRESKRELVEHPGGVSVLAVTEENKIVLVEQYRKPMELTTLEIPAGKREKGEEPIVTALRELEEETDYTCDRLEFVHSFYTSPGFADELLYLYEAIGLKKNEKVVQLDEDEFVEILEVTLEEALELIKNGRIQDAKTIIAIQYFQLQNK